MDFAFRPNFGQNSSLVTGSTTATAGVAISSSGGSHGALFANLAAAADAWIAIGSSSVQATMPTSGAGASGFPLLARTSRTIAASPGTYYSVIAATAAGAPIVTVTPGYGL